MDPDVSDSDPAGIEPLISGTPSGWYADPADDRAVRYWSGLRWTDNTRTDMARRTPPTADDLAQRATAAPSPDPPSDENQRFSVGPVGPTVAAIGATLLIVAVFLQSVSPPNSIPIRDNSLIQAQTPLAIAAIAIAIAVLRLAYDSIASQRRRKGVAILGTLALLGAIAVLFNDSLYELTYEGPRSFRRALGVVDASPGVGPWMLAVGAALALAGGIIINGSPPETEVPSPETPAPATATKVCPDCAERVQTAARKCRFCGYRFDGVPSET